MHVTWISKGGSACGHDSRDLGGLDAETSMERLLIQAGSFVETKAPAHASGLRRS